MSKRKHFIFRVITLMSLLTFSLHQQEITAQEKMTFLQHRFDESSEIITKNTSKKQLEIIKYNLERQGVLFSYSKLKYNSNKEIIRIYITLKNNKSKFYSKWNQKNLPIPNIKISDTNGIVILQSEFIKPETNLNNNIP